MSPKRSVHQKSIIINQKTQKIMKKCYSLPQTKMLEVAANQMICASGSQGGGGGATQPVSIKKATKVDVSFD